MSECTSLSDPQGHTLLFLGTGASCGVPAYYCGCKACEEALTNPKARRGCSSIMITGVENTLIDTSPELRLQFIREGVSDVGQVLYTHEHFDHVGGLGQLEYYSRLRSKKPLPLYAGKQTAAYIRSHFDFMDGSFALHEVAMGQTLVFDGISYTTLPANHAPGTFGYLIEVPAQISATGQRRRIGYFPDTGPLGPEACQHLLGIDILIIDATFNGDNWMPSAHHTIDDAIEAIEALGARKAYLVHLSMHYDTPITLVELEEKLAPYEGRIEVPFDGLRLAL